MTGMLQATLLTTAEEIINQLLKRDPVTLQHLTQLNGKVITIHLTQPDMELFLLPNSEGLQIQSVYNDTPDATLSGRATDFFTLLSSQNKADAMFGKSIQISGDSALATRLQQILSDARIDWEEMLSEVIGELPAHQLALYAVWKAQWYKNTADSLLQNLDEYLKEEARIVPTRPEADFFYDEIEAMQERVERLNARFKQLADRAAQS